MPPTDSYLTLALALLSIAPSLLTTLLHQRLSAIIHRLTHRPHAVQKTVLILGGSFAGVALAERLLETLPPTHRVMLVERNSHMHYLFAFPRFSVVGGHERKAFIPYNFIGRGKAGVFELKKGEATYITPTHVGYRSRDTIQEIEWDYLAIATGSSQPPPARVDAFERDPACAELQHMQALVKGAQSVAVVGAGAVGVEFAADVKSYFPEKDVTLIHSRVKLLGHFGERVHGYVVAYLGEIGRPNSGLIAQLLPGVISPTQRILVHPTLQIKSGDTEDCGDEKEYMSRIYALGDVAEHAGPRMARAARFQADVVAANIVASIKSSSFSSSSLTYSSSNLRKYIPRPEIEGSLTLTLGKSHMAMYVPGKEILVSADMGHEDMNVGWAWRSFGAKEDDS